VTKGEHEEIETFGMGYLMATLLRLAQERRWGTACAGAAKRSGDRDAEKKDGGAKSILRPSDRAPLFRPSQNETSARDEAKRCDPTTSIVRRAATPPGVSTQSDGGLG
jgi:hypothetical protein